MLSAQGQVTVNSLLAISSTEGTKLNWGLCLHNLGRSIDRQVHALSLLLFKLLLDPEVCDP